ncbi:MAG: ATP-binding protein [Eggerthellaceae bacterium]|nr:ATP-binding protein [Eggerthellaceae bacterium]
MQRNLMNDLVSWKTSRNRKPLIIYGARQTGKTWLMDEFGSLHYDKVARIDFTDNERMRQVFSGDFDIPRILSQLSIEANVPITPGKTLIIFDEIQEVPRALSALKYFYEKAPELHLVAAGSLLGVALHEGTSFPVGKVDSLRLHPMSFDEFLRAMGRGLLADAVDNADFESLQPLFCDELAAFLKEYLFVGGMPEVVADYSVHRDFMEARRLQLNILRDYDRDFSKHIPVRMLEKARLIWGSIPSQLAKENKRFVFGAVRQGARAKDLEEAIQWLRDYGAVRKVEQVSTLRAPLKSYASLSEFKLFVLDVGLLGALAGLDASVLLENSVIFTEFKGSLAEQYVEQQLEAHGLEPFYWSSSTSVNELDFVIDFNGRVVPIEVKAKENLRSKSLQAAREKFASPVSVRTSLSAYRDEGWLVNVPLWAIGSIRKILAARQV